MDTLNKRGDYIRKKRKEMGLSQMQLAEMVGTTDKTISTWENGKSDISPENGQMLANALGVSFVEILAGEDNDLSEEKKQVIDQAIINELSERIDDVHKAASRTEERTNKVEERELLTTQLGFYAFGIAIIALFMAWYAAFPSEATFVLWIVMCAFGIVYMIFGKRWADKIEKSRQAEKDHMENK